MIYVVNGMENIPQEKIFLFLLTIPIVSVLLIILKLMMKMILMI
nr:MAG TPA: hypothetical protein [Caudoviricetes sp.]